MINQVDESLGDEEKGKIYKVEDDDIEILDFTMIRSKMEGISLFLNLQEFEKVYFLKNIAEKLHLRVQTLIIAIIAFMGLTFIF